MTSVMFSLFPQQTNHILNIMWLPGPAFRELGAADSDLEHNYST